MTTAFVLGNGKSRLEVDLNLLKKHGKTYGCNRLYQDFKPDVLVATDAGIALEIQESGYAKRNVFYTRKPFANSGAKKITINFGFSSGPVAVTYAAHDKNSPIYLIGFDFAGTKGMFNNVYADTLHYKKSTEKETYYGNWVNQIVSICKQYKNRQFIRVVMPDNLRPGQFESVPNFNHMEMADFLAVINS